MVESYRHLSVGLHCSNFSKRLLPLEATRFTHLVGHSDEGRETSHSDNAVFLATTSLLRRGWADHPRSEQPQDV